MIAQLTARGALGLIAVFVGLTLTVPPAVSAQTPVPTPPKSEDEYPDLLDGTLSGKGDQDDIDALRPGFMRFPTLLAPWFALKQEWRKEYGLAIGGSYGILWQNYSQSLIGEDDAVGSKFALNTGTSCSNATSRMRCGSSWSSKIGGRSGRSCRRCSAVSRPARCR